MIGLTRRARVFVYAKPTDLRKSFFTLGRLVSEEMDGDPLSGDIFVFVNKRCTLTKCLSFDGTGLCLFMKRISEGRFAAPWQRAHDDVITMTSSELALFIEGSKLAFIGGLSPSAIRPKPGVTRSLSV
jgi:transposase